ncbi:hypothetical protein HYS49_01105 [Candidatus Woesearchaeota archaeon]|nr:hypothetical protein [Candidatus Woesearchaeota archaeon]
MGNQPHYVSDEYMAKKSKDEKMEAKATQDRIRKKVGNGHGSEEIQKWRQRS